MNRFAPVALCAMLSTAFAGQELVPPTANITVDFGGGVLSGAGRLIRATNVPVVINGATFFYNADFEFEIMSDGRFAAIISTAGGASGPPTIPSDSSLNFLPGTYRDADNCAYTLSPPSIGQDGGRFYIISKILTNPACPTNAAFPTYSWSTLPAPLNSFVITTAAQKALYATDVAWGLGSNGGRVRVFAVGNFISLTGYTNDLGLTFGAPVTFTKE